MPKKSMPIYGPPDDSSTGDDQKQEPNSQRRKNTPPQKMGRATVDTLDSSIPKNEVTITLTMPTGEKQPLLIPAPTDDDINWARGQLEDNYQTRSNTLQYRSDENHVWRIYFLLEQNRLRDNAFLDINYCENSTALGRAAATAKHQNMLLLMHYGADIHKAKSDAYTPIRRAINNDRLDAIDLLFHAGATIDITGIIESDGYNSTRIHALNRLMNKQNLPIITQQVPSPSMPSKTNSVWVKMGEQSIAHITEAKERFRLNKVFNFCSHEIERFTESLNAQGQIVHVGSPVTQEFASVQQNNEIKTAHEELKAQGGKLEPIATYLSGTRRISRRPK